MTEKRQVAQKFASEGIHMYKTKKGLNKREKKTYLKKEVDDVVLRLLDGRYGLNSKVQIVIGYMLLAFGFLLLISALPRQTSGIIDLKFFTINIGTQLDIIRLIIGIVLGYVGYKGVKFGW